MNIHGYKTKIKELKNDVRKNKITFSQYQRRRNTIEYAIKKLKEKKLRTKKR